MIRLRKECPEIGWGEWRVVPTGSRALLALEYRWRGTSVVCVHNLGPEGREAALRIGGGTLKNLIDEEELARDAGGVHRVPLEPYGYRWFRHGAATRALAQRTVEQPVA